MSARPVGQAHQCKVVAPARPCWLRAARGIYGGRRFSLGAKALGAGNLTALAAVGSRAIGGYAQNAAFELPSVECAHGGAGFVTFHGYRCKTFALAGEQVFRKFQGTDGAVIGEQVGDVGFSGGPGKTPDGNNNHIRLLEASSREEEPAAENRVAGTEERRTGEAPVRQIAATV